MSVLSMLNAAARRFGARNVRGAGGGMTACFATCSPLHQLAEALGNAVDARDPLLYRHSRDVAEVACLLACAMGRAPEEIDIIHIAGHLHDIGKLGVPDAVLNKQGALDEEEWRWVRRHPEIGAEIVRPVPGLNRPGGVADIILHHHERFDGKGYPRGLAAGAIPPGARIVAVADTLSALLRNRSYRSGCSFADACAEIRRCSGSQFDPAVVVILDRNREAVARLLADAESSGGTAAVPLRSPSRLPFARGEPLLHGSAGGSRAL